MFTNNIKKNIYLQLISVLLFFTIMIILPFQTIRAAHAAEAFDQVNINEAAMKMVQFCSDPKNGLDEQALSTLIDYVLSSKQNREHALPKSSGATGAYYEFDAKIAFPLFIEYSQNPQIPPSITRPSSLRYSVWTTSQGNPQYSLNNWKQAPPVGSPIIIHGMQRESDTPDLNTGVYHEYNLKRTLILFNNKGRQALISISKQVGQSDVGRKGAILGNDNDWNYYYSGKAGTSIGGLGWVKSYIYDFFSIGVYTESGIAPTMVRAGVFQWLRAGWTGMNFVKSNHILNGMERFARNFKMILESPRLPAPNQIVSVQQWLSSMPADDLIKKYTNLQLAQRSLALQFNKISKSEGEEQLSFAETPKRQMVEELMLEYIKTALGKPALLGKQSFLQHHYDNIQSHSSYSNLHSKWHRGSKDKAPEVCNQCVEGYQQAGTGDAANEGDMMNANWNYVDSNSLLAMTAQ